MDKKRKLWIDVAASLVQDPRLQLLCPNCAASILVVKDIPFDEMRLELGGERLLTCVSCGTTEAILIRKPNKNFGTMHG